MFQILKSKSFFFVLFLTFISIFGYNPSNSNTKSFNYTYDCSYLFSNKSCNLLELTFADEVFSNPIEKDLENLNEYIQDSYIFKRKFVLKKDSNNTQSCEYSMVLSEDIYANESIAVFFSQEEVLNGKSLGRSYLRSFKDIDLHLSYPEMELPTDDLQVTLVLLYHLYHIKHSKFEENLRLIPRELRIPAISLSEYELNLLEEDTFGYNLTLEIRQLLVQKYRILTNMMQKTWSKQEINSFLNGREEIPRQDFVYAWLFVQSRGWTVSHEKSLFVYLPPVIMHLKYAENFYINKTRLYRYLTGRDLYSTKIFNRYQQKELDVLDLDIIESKSEHLMMFNSMVPKRNDYDCVNIRVIPEYVAKDWMKDSTGEECFDRVLDQQILNYHLVALHMNMNEEDRYKCELIIKRNEHLDIPQKQQLVYRRCPFSGYNSVDLWNHTFIAIEEELKPEYKARIKKVNEYIKVRKELGLDTTNGELIKKLLQGKLLLIDDVKKIMKEFREFSLNRIKSSKEAEKMSFDKRPTEKFSENKIEL